MSSLRYTLEEQGIQLWGEAREGFDGYYASVVPYLERDHYGAPNHSFEELSSGDYPGQWGFDEEGTVALDAMVVTISKERAGRTREYNGPTVVVANVHRGGDQLQLNLASSNYVSVLAAQALGYGDRFRVLGVHTALVTSDRQLCLSRRSMEVASMPGRIDTTAGGMVEPPAGPLQPDLDLQQEALREVHAEVHMDLRLDASEIAPRMFGVSTLDDQASAALLCEADIPYTFDELAALRVDTPPPEAWEIAEIIGLPLPDPQSIHWLREHIAEFTPAGLASAFLSLSRVHGAAAVEKAWQDTWVA